MFAGNFLGPLVFKEEEAPYYTTGWIVTVATSCGAVVCCLIYRLICAWENRKRDRLGEEAFDHVSIFITLQGGLLLIHGQAYEDDLTDKKNLQFRYTL